MALPKRWPDPRAKWAWEPPEDWSAPDSTERVRLLDPGPLMPGDYVDIAGRVMQVAIRSTRNDGTHVFDLVDAH